MDQKEYQDWNSYWKEKLVFPLKKNKLSNSKRIPIEVLKNIKRKTNRRGKIILFNETKKNNMMFDFLNTTMNAANTNNVFAKGFPNFTDFNFFNFGQKTEEKNSAPKQEKNMDDLMTQIDKLKKEVEEIKSQK